MMLMQTFSSIPYGGLLIQFKISDIKYTKSLFKYKCAFTFQLIAVLCTN